jgi:pyridinium-3,5-biscarboxylic acid mononucleotide sulfurtransferase
VLRVRHFGGLGRIELAADELARPAPVIAAVRGAGYRRAEISEQPFRSASLNRLDIQTVAPR